MGFNVTKIFKKMYYESAPEAYKKYKGKKLDEQHQQMFDQWLKDKNTFCERNPGAPLVEDMKQLTSIMDKIMALKKVVLKQWAFVDSQRRWLDLNSLPTDVIKADVETLNE